MELIENVFNHILKRRRTRPTNDLEYVDYIIESLISLEEESFDRKKEYLAVFSNIRAAINSGINSTKIIKTFSEMLNKDLERSWTERFSKNSSPKTP